MPKTKEKGSPYQPSCPRCFRTELRPQHKRSYLVCRSCDYTAHWRQFFPGEWERKEVRKLFAQGKVKGNPFIPRKEKEQK